MAIEITSRHIDVDETVKDHARSKAEHIVGEFPRVEHVHVILDGQKYRQIAEIVVQAKNHIRVEASNTDEDMIKAIDLSAEKVQKQLRKARKKVQEHRGAGLSEAEREAAAATEDGADLE
jgi:putative sigma-54 modulation protein